MQTKKGGGGGNTLICKRLFLNFFCKTTKLPGVNTHAFLDVILCTFTTRYQWSGGRPPLWNTSRTDTYQNTSFVNRHTTTELAQEALLPTHIKILRDITIHVARKATEKSSWPKKLQRRLVIHLEGNTIMLATTKLGWQHNNASYHTWGETR